MSAVSSFLNKEDLAQIVTAIEASELVTSGEIRVHIESLCKGDALERAAVIFRQLKMGQTKEQNGVLVYIAFKSQRYAILGDKGIHEKVATDFWEQTGAAMHQSFIKKDYCGGICRTVYAIGAQLARLFPYKQGDVNELDNAVSVGE